MSKSDWAFLALNAFLALWAFAGFASTDQEALIVGAMLAMLIATANGIRIVRGRKNRDSDTERAPGLRRRSSRDDEMDARTVLDIDARLEALERRERRFEEAERIRLMTSRGEQQAPADAIDAVNDASRERVRT